MVVAITGASGVIYGIKMLECLTDKDLETQYDVEYVKSLADYSHLFR